MFFSLFVFYININHPDLFKRKMRPYKYFTNYELQMTMTIVCIMNLRAARATIGYRKIKIVERKRPYIFGNLIFKFKKTVTTVLLSLSFWPLCLRLCETNRETCFPFCNAWLEMRFKRYNEDFSHHKKGIWKINSYNIVLMNAETMVVILYTCKWITAIWKRY